MLISHVGIAVKDLKVAIEKYKLLTGSDPESVEEVVDQKVRVAIFSESNANQIGGRLELLEATSPDSPIARFVEKKGEGIHHICVYVDDIEAKLAELENAGLKLIDKHPRVGAGGTKIAFVHPADMGGVLLELEEKVG